MVYATLREDSLSDDKPRIYKPFGYEIRFEQKAPLSPYNFDFRCTIAPLHTPCSSQLYSYGSWCILSAYLDLSIPAQGKRVQVCHPQLCTDMKKLAYSPPGIAELNFSSSSGGDEEKFNSAISLPKSERSHLLYYTMHKLLFSRLSCLVNSSASSIHARHLPRIVTSHGHLCKNSPHGKFYSHWTMRTPTSRCTSRFAPYSILYARING